MIEFLKSWWAVFVVGLYFIVGLWAGLSNTTG